MRKYQTTPKSTTNTGTIRLPTLTPRLDGSVLEGVKEAEGPEAAAPGGERWQ